MAHTLAGLPICPVWPGSHEFACLRASALCRPASVTKSVGVPDLCCNSGLLLPGECVVSRFTYAGGNYGVGWVSVSGVLGFLVCVQLSAPRAAIQRRHRRRWRVGVPRAQTDRHMDIRPVQMRCTSTMGEVRMIFSPRTMPPPPLAMVMGSAVKGADGEENACVECIGSGKHVKGMGGGQEKEAGEGGGGGAEQGP